VLSCGADGIAATDEYATRAVNVIVHEMPGFRRSLPDSSAKF